MFRGTNAPQQRRAGIADSHSLRDGLVDSTGHQALLAVLPTAGCIWLLTGGLFYTSGIVFYALDHRYPWMHGVWHLFMLADAINHQVAILIHV